MILVDTSVWIEFFRGTDRSTCRLLESLLDEDRVALAAPVRIEILSGCSRKDLIRMGGLLSALEVFYPTPSTWELMETWVEKAVSVGQRFGVGDLLIGSIAAEKGVPVWSLDSDFVRMAGFGWLKLHKL